MIFRSFLAGLGAVVLLATAPVRAVHADQNDFRLEALFVQLKNTKDSRDARRITHLIWDIWSEVGHREAQRYFLRGVVLMSQASYAAAIANFDESIARAPEFSEAWNKRATAYFLVGDFDASVADIKRTLRLEPRHFGALAGLGMIYREIGDDKAALRAYDKALHYNPHLSGAKAAVKTLREKLKGERT